MWLSRFSLAVAASMRALCVLRRVALSAQKSTPRLRSELCAESLGRYQSALQASLRCERTGKNARLIRSSGKSNLAHVMLEGSACTGEFVQDTHKSLATLEADVANADCDVTAGYSFSLQK